MIILDTNVVSELMKSAASARVTTWFRRHAKEDLSTTVITVAEILRGIRRLPSGRRQAGLEQRFEAFLDLGFRNRIFPFDEPAADFYASIVTTRDRRGSPIGIFDAMIAGIARSRTADVATRDVAGFEGCGVGVLDPWSGSRSAP